MNSKAWFAIALLLAVCGCASARKGIGDNVTAEKIVEIVPGETTESQVRMIFGKPDIANDLGDGELEYTYIQGKNENVSWLLLSGYLLYNPNEAFVGNRILIVRFRDGLVRRYLASNGKLTLKKGYEKAEEGDSTKEEEK